MSDNLVDESTDEGTLPDVDLSLGLDYEPEEEIAPIPEEEVEETPIEDFDRNVSKSHVERPALIPSTKDGIAPILDVSLSGIFADPDLMTKFFPRVKDIISNARDVTSLTTEEVNELSRYALAKALYSSDAGNAQVGMIDNQLHSEAGTFGPMLARPKYSEGDELDLTDIATLGISIHGGGVVTIPLPNSGPTIKMEPFSVNERIKLEERLTHRLGELGRSTLGGGILAMDAIIIDNVLDLVLNKVIGHNIKDVEISDKAALRELLSHKDIRFIIAVMNAIMYLDGYDYDVPCVDCGTLNRMNLNVLRSIQYDHGRLSQDHINILRSGIKAELKVKDIRKYQETLQGHATTKELTFNGITYRIHLRTGSIQHKMDSYAIVFRMLTDLARELVRESGSLSPEAIDEKATEVLQRMWHLHFLPFISSIDVVLPDKVRSASKPEAILQLLKNLSIADTTGDLAAILTEFSHANVVSFATHVPTCTGCGKTTDTIRHYDPVVDFFIRRMSHTLSTSIVQEVMSRS